MSGAYPVPVRPPAPKGGPASLALSFLLGTLTRNLPAKLAALLLAMIVWFVVRQDLTATYVADQCTVQWNLEKGLVWLEDPPSHLRVEFDGPRSQIHNVKRSPTVSFHVRKEMLKGQPEASIPFPRQGDLRHAYGDEIRVLNVGRGRLELRVAVMRSKVVRVLKPVLTGRGADWQEKVEILTPEVTLLGPRSSLDRIDELRPEPMDVSWLFEGRTRAEPVGPLTLDLVPPRLLEELRITVEGGVALRCKVEFPLEVRKASHAVPIQVWHPPDPPVFIFLKADEKVRKNAEGAFEIEIEFLGAPSDLEVLRRAVEQGEVKAYVLAEDSVLYKPGAEGSDFIKETALKIHNLPPGVDFKPPAQEIAVQASPQ